MVKSWAIAPASVGSTSSACSAAALVARTSRRCAAPISFCSRPTALSTTGSQKWPSASAASPRSTISSPLSGPTRRARSASQKARMAARAGPLGIIAGSGALPRRLVENCRAAGRPVFVLALQGEAHDATVPDVPPAWSRIGAAARVVALGLEAAEGIDDLLLAGVALRGEGAGGVLVKMAKPGQERRADRPTIGLRTVALAAAAGLRGIAAEAGMTLVIDRAELVRAAD